MKIEDIPWQLGKIEVFTEGVVINRGIGEYITVPNRAITDLIFTLANIEQEKALTGAKNERLSETEQSA